LCMQEICDALCVSSPTTAGYLIKLPIPPAALCLASSHPAFCTAPSSVNGGSQRLWPILEFGIFHLTTSKFGLQISRLMHVTGRLRICQHHLLHTRSLQHPNSRSLHDKSTRFNLRFLAYLSLPRNHTLRRRCSSDMGLFCKSPGRCGFCQKHEEQTRPSMSF
jgi:hypothetical protein